MEQLLAVANDVHRDGLATEPGHFHDPHPEPQRRVVVEVAELELFLLLPQRIQKLGVVVHVTHSEWAAAPAIGREDGGTASAPEDCLTMSLGVAR